MKKSLSCPESGAIDKQLPPRQRILAAARALFAEHGIRAVGVESIAEAAGSNKMTLYRHFASKDALVAAHLQALAVEADAYWDRIVEGHPGDPRAQLNAWLAAIGQGLATGRGCPLSNAAVELPEKDHPARPIIEAHKRGSRNQLVDLCRAIGVTSPELLADELFLLIEGARVSAQSVGPNGPGAQFMRMAEVLIQAHTAR
ncbi:MAG TPA: helix-turn-helix domain-containing protein [Pantanalinema sp.]